MNIRVVGPLAGADAVLAALGAHPAPEGEAFLVTGEDAMVDVRALVDAGAPILAVGDGVAVLSAAGVLPPVVAADGAVRCSHVRVEGRPTPFTFAIPAGRILPACPDGAPAWDLAAAAAVEAEGGVVLRDCDEAGGARPRDRRAGVTAVCGARPNVVAVLRPLSDACLEQLAGSLRLYLARSPRVRSPV